MFIYFIKLLEQSGNLEIKKWIKISIVTTVISLITNFIVIYLYSLKLKDL